MIDRILLVLKTQNLTSSQFADEIGVQRSSISHILSGRNNPSLEFVTKILKRFPDINSEWILFGKGSMYRESDASLKTKQDKKSGIQPDLFSFDEPEPIQVEMPAIKESDIQQPYEYENLIEEKPQINLLESVENKEVVIENEEGKFEGKMHQIEKTESIVTECKKSEPAEPENKKKTKEIEKIVIFYTDRTFREYYQE